MFSKLILVWALVGTLVVSASEQVPEATMSRAEIARLIPISNDLLNAQERENLLRLIASVDLIYPDLCDELLSRNDPISPGTIMVILGKTQRNKEPIAKCIREFMRIHKSDQIQLERSIPTGISVLGEIGCPDDVDFLSEFLNSDDDLNRTSAKKAIERILVRAQASERDAARTKRAADRRVNHTEDADPNSYDQPAPKSSTGDKDPTSSNAFWIWSFGAAALIAMIVAIARRASH